MTRRRVAVFTLAALTTFAALTLLTAAAGASIPTNDPIFSMTRHGAGTGGDAATALAATTTGTLYTCGYVTTATHKLDMTIQRLSDAPYGWSRTFDGAAHRNDQAWVIATGPQATLYVGGNSANAHGTNDVVVLKYSSAGKPLWAHRWPEPYSLANDYVTDLAVDKYGNVVVMVGSARVGGLRTVVAKYLANGHLAWSRTIGGGPSNLNADGSDLTLDAFGNAYVAGTRTPNGGGYNRAMLVKFSAAGAKLWDRTYQNPAHLGDGFTAICRCPAGGVYVVGFTTTLGPDEDGLVMRYSATGSRTVIAQLAGSAGTAQWLRDVHVDTHGRIDICGNWFNANCDFYAAQLTAAGTLKWSYTWALGSGVDQAKMLVVDTANRVTVAGTTDTAGANSELYVVNFAANGTPRWESRYPGPVPCLLYADAIARYQSSNVWICGATEGSIATGYDQFVLGWGL